MRRIKLLTLLILLALQACNYGCISAEEFGVLKLKDAKLFASPFSDSGIRAGLVIECKKNCNKNGVCKAYNYWTSLTEDYNDNFTYKVKALGQVSFCGVSNIEEKASVKSALAFNLLAVDAEKKYVNNQEISTWLDVSGKNIHALQNDNLLEVNCDSSKTALLTSRSGTKVSIAGNHANLDSAVKENLRNIYLPIGCKLQLYDKENYQGWNFLLTGGDYVGKNHDLYTTNYGGNCTGNSYLYTTKGTYYLSGTGYLCAYNERISFASHNIGDGDDLDDLDNKILGIEIPAGCKMAFSYHCEHYAYIEAGSVNLNNFATIYGAQNDVSGIRVEQDTNPRWQANVSSARLSDDPATKQNFAYNTNMQPKFTKDVFKGNLPALKFDGQNDFYYFDNAKSFMQKEYTLFFILKNLEGKNLNGTLISSTKADLKLNDRYFIENSQLKYQSGDNIYTLSNYVPSPALIAIRRYQNKITVRINDAEQKDIIAIPAINNDISSLVVGQYWGRFYYPQDFFTGYMGNLIGYNNNLTDQEFNQIASNLMIRWKILDCGFAKNLDKVRLRIGGFESNEVVFDAGNNFFIPPSYSGSKGNMMFRLADPKVEANGCNVNNMNESFYQDNLGSLQLNVRINKNDSSFVGNLYDYFVVPIENYLMGTETTKGIEEHFFMNVVGKGSLIQTILSLSLTFFVIFTAVSYLLGLVKYSNWELMVRILKVGIIISLVSDGSWDFFKEYIIGFFRGGSLDMIGDIVSLVNSETGVISQTDNSGVKGLFKNLDDIFAMFTSSQVNAKILGLLFFPPFIGFLMICMFYVGFYIFIHIIAKILILYVSIFIMMSFAFIVAPIFIIFALFERTKEYFTKWLDLVIGYAIQFIFLVTVVTIFSWIILAVFIDLLNYTVCWKPVLYCCGGNTITNFTLLEFFRPASYDYKRFSMDVKQHYAPELWDVALFLFIIYLFKEFLNFAMDLASQIAGGVSSSTLADTIGKTLGTDDLLKTAGNAVSNTSKYAMKTVGAGAYALGSVAAGIGLASKGIDKLQGKDYKPGTMAKATNKLFSVARKLTKDGRGSYHHKLSKKISVHNLVGKRLDKAIFGIRKPKEQQLINDINQTTKSAIIEAAETGYKEDSRENFVKDRVRRMLENKGYDDKKIAKIVNSSQLNKDIKFSKLQTADAKNILTDAYKDAYNKHIKNNKDDIKGAENKGKEAFAKAQKNIGKMLVEEKNIQDNREGVFGLNIRRGAATVYGDSAQRRLANMARMSNRLAKDLESYDGSGKGFYEKVGEAPENIGNWFTDKYRSTKGRFTDSPDSKKTKEAVGEFLGAKEDKDSDLDNKLDDFFKSKKDK